MVAGIDIFKQYFNNFTDNYIIIGGTACDIILDEAGFNARATKDIDIILIVEALNKDFTEKFWQFIQDGKYEKKERSDEQRQYYRFIKPENKDFPTQMELFSRNPDIKLFEDSHLTPIPLDDDLSSLSAILLNDEYYKFVIEQSQIKDGVHYANIESLICLKAKAYLEIEERILNDENSQEKGNLKKHKGDVFRLAVLLSDNNNMVLPEKIKSDLQKFVNKMKDNLPTKDMFTSMGMKNIDVNTVYERLIKSFQLVSPNEL